MKGQVAEKDQEITKEKKKIAKMIAEMHILCVILLLCIACWVGIGCWMVKKRQVDNHVPSQRVQLKLKPCWDDVLGDPAQKPE